MGQMRLPALSPTPCIELITILGDWQLDVDLIASTSALIDWINRSLGESGEGAAKGLSETRRRLSVEMMASGGLGVAKALARSVEEDAEPQTTVRFGCWGSFAFDDSRMSAVTVWEFARAASRARRPLRPVAPINSRCIF